MIKHIIIRISEDRNQSRLLQAPSRSSGGSEGQVDEWSVVLPLVFWTPLNERRAQVDQLLKQVLFKDPSRHVLKQIKITYLKFVAMTRWGGNYLSCGAGLVAGSYQVWGVGQVDEQFLLRLRSRSWKIQQENLQREQRQRQRNESTPQTRGLHGSTWTPGPEWASAVIHIWMSSLIILNIQIIFQFLMLKLSLLLIFSMYLHPVHRPMCQCHYIYSVH